MTDSPLLPPLLVLLREAIIAAAQGETVRQEPADLRRTDMKATTLLAGQDGTPAGLPPDSLPPDDRMSSLMVGAYPLILGAVTAEHTALDEVRRFANQAAVSRTWLHPEQADNLQVFLVGPLGSDASPFWRDRRSQIERDERICRKLMWLPPEEPVALSQSLDLFLARTFLVRPWTKGNSGLSSQLDSLSAIARTPLKDGLPLALTKEWLDILNRAAEGGEELAAALCATLERNQ
ncbi:MAG: hypothetical protein HQL38_00895 [Alphaproteobacteria bacterium]|nr:hypothetical protein [Alphaproteobacteria bacterium]